MLNHRNLIDNVVHLEMGIEPGSAVLMTVLPIHHAYCFTCDILKGLQLGSTICINDSLMRIAKNLQVFKPNTMLVGANDRTGYVQTKSVKQRKSPW